MPVAADYPFLDILWTMILFFAWLTWIWTAVAVLSDTFHRDDLSGWGKAGWTLIVILLPFLGVLVYLGMHGKEMGERRAEQVRAQQAQVDDYIRDVSGDSGPTAEIARANRLLEQGAISRDEFEQIKQKALS